jgi:gamma-tubulin complex component 3
MELDSSKQVPILIERLLKQSLPSEHIQSYKPYFLRLVSMKIEVSSYSEKTIVQKISKRLNSSNSQNFREFYTKLIKSKSLNTRKSILYLLYKVSGAVSLSLFPLETPKPFLKTNTSVAPRSKTSSVQVSKLEKELVQDLLSIFQGTDGENLKYSHLEDKYSMQSSYCYLPLIKMLDEITEMGYLHKKVIKYINTDHITLAAQSLSMCLQNELSEYYRLIALFQKDPEINIKKIYLWVTEPLERMKWLALISEATETLRGTEMVSAIYSYCAIGHCSIKTMIFRILDKVSTCLMNMIELWITQGEINDPYHEFFTTENENIEEQDLWSKKFSLVSGQIPYFFNQNTVQEIFLTGKTINFLKLCCKQEWNCYIKNSRPSIYDLQSFDTWAHQASTRANTELLEVLFKKYKLSVHLFNIKKSLLLGQGDFHHSLMEQLLEILKENAKRIHKHNLRSILENSIRNSNLQYEDQEFLNHYDIKLLDPNPLDSGWEVFTLDYIFSSPLTTIFTYSVMETYTKIFKFLWHVKRAQFLLNEYQHIRSFLSFQSNGLASNVIKLLMILRHALRHFVNNFMSYLMLEVIETAWNKFYSNLSLASNLDEVISTHASFLEVIYEKTLVKDKDIQKKVMSLLNLCIMSQNIHDQVFWLTDFRNGIDTVQTTENLIKASSDIKDLRHQFNEELKNFRQILLDFKGHTLKYLAFRLDFNEYYEFQSFYP